MDRIFQTRREGHPPHAPCRRGSVLMEFIIVFPIYLVLIGGIFMVGDMLIKTTRLASAERSRALDIAAGDSPNANADWGWNAANDTLFPPVSGTEEDKISEFPSPYRYHSQGSGFQGPWTVAVASKIKDTYKLAAWTRGWLSFAHWFFEDTTGTADDLDAGDKVMLPLLSGGSAEMFSKDVNKPRVYNYYTYRRTRDYSSSELKKMYRAMPREMEDAGRIVDAAASGASWKRYVADESMPALESAGGEGGNKRSSVSLGLVSRKYERYSQYMRWSE